MRSHQGSLQKRILPINPAQHGPQLIRPTTPVADAPSNTNFMPAHRVSRQIEAP
jgi:hypothetical protein